MGWKVLLNRHDQALVGSSRHIVYTTYLSTALDTYCSHGAGKSEGPEAWLFESRRLPSEAMGGIERDSARIGCEHVDRGRRHPTGTGRPVRGVSDRRRSDDRRRQLERPRVIDAVDYGQLHRWLQHDQGTEPRGDFSRSAA